MKKLPIILIALVFVSVGAYFLTQNKQKPVSDNETGTSQTKEGENTVTGNLKKILSLNRPLKCSWRRGEELSGTSWIKNEMFFNEVTAQGQTSKVIFKNDCMWTWQEGKTQGVKMCFEPEEAEEIVSGQTEATEQTETSMPTDVDYKCQPATVSEAMFNPPASIQFMDIDQLMQGMGN